uniref:TonB-dependent receptor domain-containing protein n=1 Tax=uncultured Sphingomonas sp. TaxID=158754 RepID=UPI0035CA735F
MLSKIYASGLAGVAVIALCTPAAAQPRASAQYDVPAQDLATTLRRVAQIGRVEILFAPSDVAGLTAPAIQGELTLSEAIERALAGSGLSANYGPGAVIIRGRSSPQRVDAADETGANRDIVVTGSRIRGAPVASPVITLTAESAENAGQHSLGEVVRSLPQSFGGGQNPGIGITVPSTSGVNVGGASTINLRGLGSDATLTLLDGHRLSYNGSRQGIDVSSIPLGAVERIEIVADGASALYGSDAVAGVANIILKRTFDGVETSVRYGSATEGAYSEQQYGAVAGTHWRSGGVVAAYEYASNSRLLSSDRSFATSRPGVTLYPEQWRHVATLVGHQALSDTLTFEVDALYNRRWNNSGFPLNLAGDLSVSRSERDATSTSWAVTPSLKLDVPGGWRASLSGTYGKETVFTDIYQFLGATQASHTFICYCNNGKSVELAADGALFRMPGGEAKIALGTGYRYNLLDAFQGAGNPQNIHQAQDSYYAFGELSLPLVSAAQAIPFIHRLNLSGAVRYERYPGISSVATPKFGLIYAPSPDLDVKASWGESFRAPTLFQQYNEQVVVLYPAASLGGAGYGANATALLIAGGNPALTPERATTWTTSLDLHPRALPGARLQLSYFSTRYDDRIVTPISFTTQSLSNGGYGRLVTLNPSAAASAAIVAGADFVNITGGAFNPATVIAIVDNRSVNAGRQAIHGVDAIAEYRVATGASGTLKLDLDISYLDSNQQLFPGQQIDQKAGILFNPPHWHGRGGATWQGGPLTLNATVSYIGGVDDTRFTPVARVGSVTTLDVTGRFAFPKPTGPLRGAAFSVSVQNAFDARPTTIASTTIQDSTYDSTNYSPIGRFISLGVTKTW